MRTVAVVVDPETGKVSSLGPDQRWEIWLFSVEGGKITARQVRKPPWEGVFPPGYAGTFARVAALPRFGLGSSSPLDMVGFLEGAEALLARDFWPALVPQIGLLGITCVKTQAQKPEDAVRAWLG